MIVPVEIDTRDITSQFDIGKTEIESMLDNIAKGLAMSFVYSLELNVQRELKSTRARYLKNIRVIDSGKLQSTVLLDYSKDPMIRMLEEGTGSFDMKPGFMGSSKVKMTKKGKRYLTIPFRWAASSSVGESDVFTGKLPKAIHTIVKEKGPNSPLNLSDLPASLSGKSTRPAIEDSEGKVLFDSYKHKNSIYEGVTQSIDGATGQSRYFSFRRVSENSDPSAFIHPGIVAHKFLSNTLSGMDIETEVGKQIDVELSKLGF